MKKIFTFVLLCMAISANAQRVGSISGTVTSDADGTPIGGVIVSVEGTNNYATTDVDGLYVIDASRGDVLNFQLLGYVNQSATVGASSVINIALQQDATLIDDLVVVGYGVQKKSVVTAAISSVKASDLENQTPTRIESVLQGKVAGVNITRTSGQPGEGSTVRIRGIGTVTGDGAADPLYVVDGMQVGGGIDYLNPSDIESIEVLKDAASAAVYGTKGANGVILVTTKRGQRGDARVTYDMQYGWQNPWKLRPVLNSLEYQTLMNESALNAGMSSVPYGDPSVYSNDTNWQKEIFNFDAPMQNHQVSVSGATDRANYYVSLGYFDQEGLVGGNHNNASNYDRITLRLNNTYKLMDHSAKRNFLAKANVGIQAQYAHINNSGIGTNGVFGEALGSALLLPPTESVYISDPDAASAFIGTVAGLTPAPVVTDDQGRVFSPVDGYGEIRNPIAKFYLPQRKNWSDKFVSSFWADLELYKGLTFKSSYGVDMAFWGWNGWSRPYYLNAEEYTKPEGMATASGASAQFNRGFDWQLENTLTYTNTFADKHNLTVLLGQSARANKNSTKLEGSKTGLQAIDEDKAWIDFATALQGNVSGGAVDPYRLASYFGRLSYNYDERYMLEVTVRRDGSSRFGPSNKWGTFPSVSAGWNITNEKFAESFPEWISTLKLRASWGQNGNDAIGNFRYTVAMSAADQSRYIWGPGSIDGYMSGTKPNGIANPNLKWEATEQTDIGLDAAFFHNSLTFSFDWYRKNTKGMLKEMMIPTYVGDTKPMGNVGDMLNTGVEFEVGYRKTMGDWSFGVMANATYLKNRVENLGNAEGYQNGDSLQFVGTVNRDQNGYPYHYFWGRRTDGIFQTWDEVNSYNEAGKTPLIDANTGQQAKDEGTGELLWNYPQPNAAPGDVRFVDINGDGMVGGKDGQDTSDNVMIGKFFPDWTYNFNIDVAWKGIDMSMFWQGVAGSDLFDATRRLDRQTVNLPAYMLDRWTGPGTSNTIPRMNRDDKNNNWVSSDLYVQNGAYLRLKSLQIGYTIPENWTKAAFISRLRVYFMAENLLTITKYRGFDPEIPSGFDRGVYPQPRTLSVGLNLAF